MTKWIFAACACAMAMGAWCADTKVATRNWVIKQLTSQGLRINSATVTDNGDGTITVRSPFAYEGVTNCVSIYFTVVKPSDASDDSVVVVRPSLLSLIFPSAYASENEVGAEIGDDASVTITLSQGGWVDSVGNVHEFNFFTDGPWTLTLQDGTLNEIPSSEHLCKLDADCNCVWADYSEEDVEIPEEYQDATAAKMREYGWLDISHWVDLAHWPANLTETVGKGKKQRTVYYVCDDNGINFDIQAISETDAWVEALAQALIAINKHQKKCRDAYIQSKLCDKKNPQHDWQTKQCGGNSWCICSRNSTHGDPPNHTGHTIQGRCSCGEMASPHAIVTGVRAAKKGNTGWTRTDYCSLGCGYTTPPLDHDCIHEKCRACSAGDGCDWPCPTCRGLHSFPQSAGNDKCARCSCIDCGVTERGAGREPDPALHANWQSCGYKTDIDDERSNGAHCCCECGDFSHSRNSPHDRDDLSVSLYEDCQDDPENHWKIDKSICKRCQDPYGVKEQHEYGDDPLYKWLSNDKCAKRKICEKEGCGHEDVESEDEAGAHSPAGDPFRYDDIDEHVCRFWFHCEKCSGDYYDDSHDHDRSAAKVERYEQDGENCVQIKICARVGCGRELRDASKPHVRDPANGCKCANCKTFQFDHDWAPDACGNLSCSHCHAVMPETEVHHRWGGNTTETEHFCLCGSHHENHLFSAPFIVARSAASVTYRHVCTVCAFAKEWTVDGSAGCVGDSHMPKLEACGCVCGYYSPSNETATAAMFHYTADPQSNCLCACGKWHSYVAPSPYQLNADEGSPSARCDGICAVCKKRSNSGIAANVMATVEQHSPASRICGCRCREIAGAMTDLPAFHPQKAGSCMCCGDDGKGGRFHYRVPDPRCPGVCLYGHLNDPLGHHLAASSFMEVGRIPALPADHAKTASAACGCACGDYTNDNTPAGATSLHNQNPYDCGCYCKALQDDHKFVQSKSIGCFCACGERVPLGHMFEDGRCYCRCKDTKFDDFKQHKKVPGPNGACPAVCHGECGEATNVLYKSKHSPAETDCGCECGAFQGTDYGDRTSADAGKFHSQRSNGDTCTCKCNMRFHLWSRPRSDCSGICSLCGDKRSYLASRDPQTPAEKKDHRWNADKCVCECGKHSRDHDFDAWQSNGETTSYVCSICSREITVQPEIRYCKRSLCDASESRDRETTPHDSSMHAADSGSGGSKLMCSIHGVYYVDGFCPVEGCKNAKPSPGSSSAGGDAGETGGSGGDDDV